MNNGNVNNNNKNNNNRVRPVAPVAAECASVGATSQVVYDIPFSSVIEAWLDCEQNKRTSNSCTKFRWHAARDLVKLWREMCTASYTPHSSMCFMVTRPVLREVWAGAFRDRDAHHWECLRIIPLVEEYFVGVGDCSMNCRKGYGSLRAVHTLEKMIYDFTEGYTRDDCWIVGGDFANFFMSIDKEILWEYVEQLIMDEYTGDDKQALLYMMRTTIFHRCQDNYFKKSPEELWQGLPPRKSLFHMNGLAIGNFPNQILANLMGAIFTAWIVLHKGYKHFIIFVDDWRVLFRSAEEGRALLKEAREWLANELHITLHPDKVYLQHYSKGTKFVGAVIKPPCKKRDGLNYLLYLQKWVNRGLDTRGRHINRKKFCKFLLYGLSGQRYLPSEATARVYVSNRTRGQFISKMLQLNARAVSHRAAVSMLDEVRCSINSYLGLMCHYDSYKVRRRIAEKYILPSWGKFLYFVEDFTKCVIKNEYNEQYLIRRRLKRRNFAA